MKLEIVKYEIRSKDTKNGTWYTTKPATFISQAQLRFYGVWMGCGSVTIIIIIIIIIFQKCIGK